MFRLKSDKQHIQQANEQLTLKGVVDFGWYLYNGCHIDPYIRRIYLMTCCFDVRMSDKNKKYSYSWFENCLQQCNMCDVLFLPYFFHFGTEISISG